MRSSFKSVFSSTRKVGMITLAALGMAFGTACEKEVDLDLESTGGKTLVVEGGIETGLPPVVQLTNSLSFFSRVDLAALENAFVHDAVVMFRMELKQCG